MVSGKPRSRSMLQHARVYSKDEELGKRDDDFRPKRKENVVLQHFNPLRWRKRRFLLVFAAIIFIYLFVKNIPTDLGPASTRARDFTPRRPQPIGKKPEATATTASPSWPDAEPTGAPPHADGAEELGKHYFSGMIRYFRLGATLSMIQLGKDLNRNVLFAASSMKSLGNLLPLACEMAENERNLVHIAVMSRADLSIEDLRSINGLGDNRCSQLIWHDARSDYAEWSSDLRHEAVVAGGLTHIHTHMSPKVVIVDDESVEDSSFARGVKRRAKELFLPLIEIPRAQYDNYRFIAKLDYISLSNWYTPTIEIVVSAQKDSVGSLIRSLRSLVEADFRGIRMPKLTINLATSIQPALKTFLSNLKWPPRYEPATSDVDPVTVRHSVQSVQSTSEQGALRLVESFYPATSNHHVLILSPQVEISPQFLVYVHYVILRYKYASRRDRGVDELLGLALDIPSFKLSGQPFDVPHGVAEDETVFLYNVPSSSAQLIFGDKWSLFHNYLTHRISASRLGRAPKQSKVVPETEPAWIEYLLELMRARGWGVLYPSRAFATVHNELAQIPEEFEKAPKQPERIDSDLDEPFLVASAPPQLKEHAEDHLFNPLTPLHDILPQHGHLDDLVDLPYVSHVGERVKWEDTSQSKTDYLYEFRRTIGGCSDAEARRPRILQDDRADDLFCLPGVDMLFDTEAEGESAAS